MLTIHRCPCGAHFCYICGVQWKTCACPQWEETRLFDRAAQINQREPHPRRRLFEPARVVRPQPRTRRPSLATTAPLGLAATPRSLSPASAWQSDFSDHSEWEEDWSMEDEEEDVSVPSGLISPLILPAATVDTSPVTDLLRATFARPDKAAPAVPTSSRNPNIDALMAHLLGNHECSHDKWRWIKGPHRCEECHYRLPSYIFECKQCMLQACNRCRRNRLS